MVKLLVNYKYTYFYFYCKGSVEIMLIRYIIIWFIVLGFLPNNAKLQEPAEPKGMKAIQFIDLDKDGQNEAIATYKLLNEVPEIHLLILKKVNKQWIKVETLKANGYALDRVSFEDIDCDGIAEVLLGCKVGGIWNGINVYKVGPKGYRKVYSNIYSEIIIEEDKQKVH
jgi:hypothetical protein